MGVPSIRDPGSFYRASMETGKDICEQCLYVYIYIYVYLSMVDARMRD